nr:MAG: putative capsid protein [Arizlama virus]
MGGYALRAPRFARTPLCLNTALCAVLFRSACKVVQHAVVSRKMSRYSANRSRWLGQAGMGPTFNEAADIARAIRSAQRGRASKSRTAAVAGRRAARAGGRASSNRVTAGLLGLELKYLDQGINTTALGAPTDASGGEYDPTGGVDCIGCPLQNDTATGRNGKSYVVKSIVVQGQVNIAAQINQTAADPSCIVYIALVQDTQTVGAQAQSETVFVNPSGQVGTAAAPFRNLLYSKKYRILDSCTLTKDCPAITYDGTNIEQGGANMPFKLSWNGNVKVNCTGDSNLVAQVQDNSFHIMAFTTSTGLAPGIAYSARTRFMG